MEYIDITPTWEALVNEWERIEPYHLPEGRQIMWNEIRRLAKFADEQNLRSKNRHNGLDGVVALIGHFYPQAEFSDDSDGQIIIHLDCRVDEDGMVRAFEEEEG